MSTNLLRNGGFEADWAEEGSHRCMVIPTEGESYTVDRGNIFAPPGWTVWFKHGLPVEHDPANTVGWAQPEVRDAWASGDATRVHSGQKGILFFTFFRIHDGGFFQQVTVEPGAQLRLSAWAHAWSNAQGTEHTDDPRWSEGERVGRDHFFALEGTTDDGGERNFTFWVGIDPAGGTDPYAEGVVWGRGAHIYNAYRPVPPVEARAQANRVTVFLRSLALWPFKHNDAYWDDAVLEAVGPAVQTAIAFDPAQPQVEEAVQVTVSSTTAAQDTTLVVTGPGGEPASLTPAAVEQPPQGRAWRWTFIPLLAGAYRAVFAAAGGAEPLAEAEIAVQAKPLEVWGSPRVQYARTYLLLPPEAGREWVEAILDSDAWERQRWTIGGSADDAGIGALDDKTVIAVNPSAWPSDLRAFFQEHYPRTRYVALEAATPDELADKLRDIG